MWLKHLRLGNALEKALVKNGTFLSWQGINLIISGEEERTKTTLHNVSRCFLFRLNTRRRTCFFLCQPATFYSRIVFISSLFLRSHFPLFKILRLRFTILSSALCKLISSSVLRYL